MTDLLELDNTTRLVEVDDSTNLEFCAPSNLSPPDPINLPTDEEILEAITQAAYDGFQFNDYMRQVDAYCKFVLPIKGFDPLLKLRSGEQSSMPHDLAREKIKNYLHNIHSRQKSEIIRQIESACNLYDKLGKEYGEIGQIKFYQSLVNNNAQVSNDLIVSFKEHSFDALRQQINKLKNGTSSPGNTEAEISFLDMIFYHYQCKHSELYTYDEFFMDIDTINKLQTLCDELQIEKILVLKQITFELLNILEIITEQKKIIENNNKHFDAVDELLVWVEQLFKQSMANPNRLKYVSVDSLLDFLRSDRLQFIPKEFKINIAAIEQDIKDKMTFYEIIKDITFEQIAFLMVDNKPLSDIFSRLEQQTSIEYASQSFTSREGTIDDAIGREETRPAPDTGKYDKSTAEKLKQSTKTNSTGIAIDKPNTEITPQPSQKYTLKASPNPIEELKISDANNEIVSLFTKGPYRNNMLTVFNTELKNNNHTEIIESFLKRNPWVTLPKSELINNFLSDDKIFEAVFEDFAKAQLNAFEIDKVKPNRIHIDDDSTLTLGDMATSLDKLLMSSQVNPDYGPNLSFVNPDNHPVLQDLTAYTSLESVALSTLLNFDKELSAHGEFHEIDFEVNQEKPLDEFSDDQFKFIEMEVFNNQFPAPSEPIILPTENDFDMDDDTFTSMHDFHQAIDNSLAVQQAFNPNPIDPFADENFDFEVEKIESLDSE